MKTKYASLITVACIVLFAGVFCLSCNNEPLSGKLIISLSPAGTATANMISGDLWRYIPGGTIGIVDPKNPSSFKVLTKAFYSACSPDVSCDGQFMLFTAQEKKDGLWQIWEMDLTELTSRKVTDTDENCTDPAYLPVGRLVFSKYTDDSTGTGHALYVCNLDGTELKRITFHPHANFATSILKDGRLLSITRQLWPKTGEPKYMVTRPDGTKGDLFYQGEKGSQLLGRSRETDGRIFFIEADTAGNNANITCIRYNRPSNSRMNVTEGISGTFRAVFPINAGKLAVAYQKDKNSPLALYEFDINRKTLGKLLYADKDRDVTDIVLISAHERQKKLPSEVDMGVKTGQIMCQDINFTGIGTTEDALSEKARKIEVLGIDSSLGIIKVEEDGSFYLKVIADVPFRIRTLDEKNKVVNGPSGWMWVRPNERRGCIGCHEDHELAPANIVPLAVKKGPVAVPVIVSDLKEKEVELE